MYPTPRADQFTIADLRSAADIIEEKTDLITYLGFCHPGTTSESAPTWSIMKIEQSGLAKPVLTTFKWAEGLAAYSHKWSERNNYNYKFRNF